MERSQYFMQCSHESISSSIALTHEDHRWRAPKELGRHYLWPTRKIRSGQWAKQVRVFNHTKMAVPPTLASVLYESRRGDGNGWGRKRARTGCKVIDDALCGGIDFGCISCISGEADTGKRSVCLKIAILIRPNLILSLDISQCNCKSLAWFTNCSSGCGWQHRHLWYSTAQPNSFLPYSWLRDSTESRHRFNWIGEEPRKSQTDESIWLHRTHRGCRRASKWIGTSGSKLGSTLSSNEKEQSRNSWLRGWG